MNKVIHVVAAVIRDSENNILIAKRSDDKHQGGKWEFPGGKVDQGESVKQALKRELNEELGIQVTDFKPLITVEHDYIDKSVKLDVWEVTRFDGEAYGKEGQPVQWIHQDELNNYEFPEANHPIITAAQLPEVCLITPEPRHEPNFFEKLEAVLDSGIRLIQFRAKELSNADYMDTARTAIKLVHQYNGKILLNSPPLWIQDADGMHLASQTLMHAPLRPSMQPNKLLTAACHNEQELEKAAYLQANAVFVSPVLPTKSHPNAEPLNWEGFQALTKQVNLPVYALGGLNYDHIELAKNNGGQGIAAISAIWQSV